MDVPVLLDEPITPEIRDTVLECAWEAGFEAGILVTSVIFSRDEWENGPGYYSPFAETLRTEGIYSMNKDEAIATWIHYRSVEEAKLTVSKAERFVPAVKEYFADLPPA